MSTAKLKSTVSGLIMAALAAALFSPSIHALDGKMISITDPDQIMQEGYIQVIGVSEEGQSRFKAVRAATVVAQRDLLEAFQGVHVAGNTTIRDGMLQSDEVNTQVRGFLRGAVKCGENYFIERRYAEVCLRLNIRGKGGAYDVILPLLSEQGVVDTAAPPAPMLVPKVMTPQPHATSVETTEPATPAVNKIELAAPSELTNPGDGLVLDVSGMGFKPAIVNRILTQDGDLVFGPSQVVNSILLERGCGGFTNQSAKAKGLLATWGSNNPMELKAVSVNRGTDAVIDADSAAAIMTHDQKSSFLAQAKVVFVLK